MKIKQIIGSLLVASSIFSVGNTIAAGTDNQPGYVSETGKNLSSEAISAKSVARDCWVWVEGIGWVYIC